MLGKILNLGKKKEFYLTIDETESTDPVVTETKAKATTQPVAETEPKPTPEATVKTVEETEPKSASVKAAKQTAPKKPQTTSKKESVKKPVDSGASSWEQPFWVKAMYENNSSDSASAPEAKIEGTFATDYLVVQSTSRRRPGPSLNKFKDMVTKKRF